MVNEAIRASELTPLDHTYHSFNGAGYTIAFILGESHVVIHTWPEKDQLALIEISVCDFQRSNRERALLLAHQLESIYQPQKKLMETSSMIPRFSDLDFVSPGYGVHFDVNSLISSRTSAFQNIFLGHNQALGRFLALDGVMQTAERDEAFYHEPLVHAPLISHPEPKRVLICGGGDGGAAKQALKHPTVESCTIAEIDPEVVELSKEWLVSIHQGALSDSRVSIHIEDAADFLARSDEVFDVILLDTPDPVGNAKELFSEEFYQQAKDHLSKKGWMSLHVGAPLFTQDVARKSVDTIRGLYPTVFPYLHFVPSYGSWMGFLLCSPEEQERLSREEIAARLQERQLTDLRLFNAETYEALFAIPPCLKQVFPEMQAHRV